MPVGILANQGVLFTESALKAAHFIELCCQRDIPLLFMSDVTGFMVGREAEQGGIAKAGAKMITAMASANVPKYSILIGASYGAGYLAMCGRPFNPTAMFAWPNARSAIMGPEQAATVLALVRQQSLTGQGRVLERRGAGGLQGADPQDLRRLPGGLQLLRQPLGRRRPRPGRDPRRDGPVARPGRTHRRRRRRRSVSSASDHGRRDGRPGRARSRRNLPVRSC